LSSTSTTFAQSCAHEAGHAASALCLGLSPLLATVLPELGKGARVDLAPPPPGEHSLDLIWRWMIFGHSGALAQTRFTLDSDGLLRRSRIAYESALLDDIDTWKNAEALSFRLGCRRPAEMSHKRAIFYAARRAAKQLLREHEALVMRIRDELDQQPNVSGERLQQLFEDDRIFATSVPGLICLCSKSST